MPLSEGYGLTETAPVLTVNPLNRSRKGSAGKPLPGIELRIFQPDEEGIGEIIVRTPSLMTGYYKNPEATKKAIQAGWFHTGDLGWVDEDGYLYITGRKKDVIVTGAGKNVYPSDLEALYQEIPGIGRIDVLTVNPLNRSRKGSAGKPLPGIELQIFQPDGISGSRFYWLGRGPPGLSNLVSGGLVRCSFH